MGLDYVELLSSAEHEFDISIKNDEASGIATVGDFCDLVCCKLHGRRIDDQRLVRYFRMFRDDLINAANVARREIRPSTKPDAIIPKSERRRIWSHMRRAGWPMPELSLPRPARISVLSICLVAAAALAVRYSWLPLLITAIPMLLLVRLVTTPWATTSADQTTIRQIVDRASPSDVEPWNQHTLPTDQIRRKIRAMIAEIANIPAEQVTDDAHLFKDVGMD